MAAGSSAWYPMKQQVVLNGTVYKMDRDGLFLDEVVPPGSYEVQVSLREGFWDAASQRQIEGKRIERSFRTRVERGQNLHLHISFICDETQRDIRISTR